MLGIELAQTLAESEVPRSVEICNLCTGKTGLTTAKISKEDTFLGRQNDFMLPILSLLHRYNVSTSLTQVLRKQDLSI